VVSPQKVNVKVVNLHESCEYMVNVARLWGEQMESDTRYWVCEARWDSTHGGVAV